MSGFTEFGSKLVLAAAMPGGVDVYVALFTTVPDFDGSGGVEVSAGWYSRVAHQDWFFSVGINGLVSRLNTGAIDFADVTVDPVTVVAWGIFDAASGGNLIAFDSTRGSSKVEQPFAVGVGDNPRFGSGTLAVVIEPTDTVTIPSTLTKEDTLQTTDDTPTNFDNPVANLSDEQGVKVITEVTGQSGTDHYSRRIVKKYTRDDGGPGTTLWNVDEIQTDGVATRVGFGAGVTADLLISGDNVELEVTGEIAHTVEWRHTTTVIVDS